MFIQDLYLLAFDSAEIRTPLLHLKNEIFRKGFEDWKPNFAVKCDNCGKEFKERVENCDCGKPKLREPDEDQYKEFDKKWRLNCNIFGQSIEELMRTISDDLNIVDDGFLHLNKQYRIEKNKLYSQVVEIRRIHPALMEIDLDKNGLPKNSHWLCPFHRDNVQVAPGRCQNLDCKRDLIPAMYVYNHRGQRIYLFEDEMIHTSKFSASESYGYSPLLTVMQKVLTISGMDRFLYRYFFERKTPTQLILTNTDDPQSLEIERARIESKMMEDPTYTPWIAVNNRTGRGRTDVVRLFHTLQEMDYLNVRNEIRDRISAIYGVPQLYMNVMEGVGGISGQTQQIKMMANVVSSDQRMYNEKILPIILKSFGITDWSIVLRSPEEKIEGQVIQLAQQKVMIATQMRGMGFDVELKPNAVDIDTLDFVFGGKAMSMQDQMSGLGSGMPAPGQEGMEGEQQESSEGLLQEGQKQENPEEQVEEFAPDKNRLEESVYANKTPEEEGEDEEDSEEEEVWN